MSDEQGLLWEWRSGQRAEELRVAWNKKNGPDSDVAGGNLDGLLDCAYELEYALRILREKTIKKWQASGFLHKMHCAAELDAALSEIFGKDSSGEGGNE